MCKRTSRSNSPKVKRAVNEGKKAPCPNSLGKRAKNGGGQIQQGKANRGHQDKFDNSRADLDLKKGNDRSQTQTNQSSKYVYHR